MTKLLLLLLSFYKIFSVVDGASTYTSLEQCTLNLDNSNVGFNVRIYSPSSQLGTAINTGYFETQYLQESLLGSITGYTSNVFPGLSTTTMGGVEVSGYPGILEFTGFLYATDTDFYFFTLATPYDAGMFWFGQGSIECATGDIDESSASDFLQYFDSKTFMYPGMLMFYFYLEVGYYYPVRLTFADPVNLSTTLSFGITPAYSYMDSYRGYEATFNFGTNVIGPDVANESATPTSAGSIISPYPATQSIFSSRSVCNVIPTDANMGLRARLFDLPSSETSQLTDWGLVETGYLQLSYIGSTIGVTELSYTNSANTFYGMQYNEAGFAVEYTGFFYRRYFDLITLNFIDTNMKI